MNDRFDLRIITQPHSQVYWGYFRRLVFGNSSTKHNKLTYFSNSMLFCSDVLLPFSHIPRCIHAKTPDFPRLFEPRDIGLQNICSNPSRVLVIRGHSGINVCVVLLGHCGSPANTCSREVRAIRSRPLTGARLNSQSGACSWPVRTWLYKVLMCVLLMSDVQP